MAANRRYSSESFNIGKRSACPTILKEELEDNVCSQ